MEGLNPQHGSQSANSPVCEYCGVEDPKCIVQCIDLSCNRWFCNGYGQERQYSHLVLHLKLKTHCAIRLHLDNRLSRYNLSCRECGSDNVFELGHEPSMNVTCRSCLMKYAKRNRKKYSSWQSFVEHGRLHTDLVSLPDNLPNPLTHEQIIKLEQKAKETKDLPRIRLFYQNPSHYCRVFKALIVAEHLYEKGIKSSRERKNTKLKLKGNLAELEMGKNSLGIKIKPRMLLSVQNQTSQVEVTVVVKQVHNGKIVVIVPKNLVNKLTSENSLYRVKFTVNTVILNRLTQGLYKFMTLPGNKGRLFQDSILGANIPEVITRNSQLLLSPDSPALNDSQIVAVRKALGSSLVLIQGPPGTGKTVTATAIIYNLFHNLGKVLVAAPSNHAADEITSRLVNSNLRVTRLYAVTREEFDNPHDEISFTFKAFDVPEGHRRLTDKEVCADTDILICTCMGAFDQRIQSFKCKAVVVDESTQANEPECLLPMLRAYNKVVLIGDHKQLAAICQSPLTQKAGYFHSLFERLVNLGNVPHLLDVQYRMHPEISAISNTLFYGGSIRDATDASVRPQFSPWAELDTPVFLYSVSGPEEISASGTSFLNRTEADIALKLVTCLVQQGVSPSQIEVVTFYEGQREFLEEFFTTMLDDWRQQPQVNNIDAFQGRENDYIILSCVRSNDRGGIGFLENPRRLNVAITRAKHGMVIIGNPRVLTRGATWYDLLVYLIDHKLVYEGSLTNLRPAVVTLPKRKPSKKKPPSNLYEDQEVK